MASLIEHFDVLTKKGLEIIPLHADGKNPIFSNWQSSYNEYSVRGYLQKHPECNLGLRLGTILDIEGDSPLANQRIQEMIGDYPHPSYSSRKSIHHLFINPFPKLTRIVYQDIEFRGYRHQSVLPPSVVSGTVYQWRTIDFPIPQLPDRLITFLTRVQKRRKGDVKPGHVKLPCIECGTVCFLHQNRFELEIEVFRSMGMRWTCQKCRTVDIRPMCRKLNLQKA